MRRTSGSSTRVPTTETRGVQRQDQPRTAGPETLQLHAPRDQPTEQTLPLMSRPTRVNRATTAGRLANMPSRDQTTDVPATAAPRRPSRERAPQVRAPTPDRSGRRAGRGRERGIWHHGDSSPGLVGRRAHGSQGHARDPRDPCGQLSCRGEVGDVIVGGVAPHRLGRPAAAIRPERAPRRCLPPREPPRPARRPTCPDGVDHHGARGHPAHVGVELDLRGHRAAGDRPPADGGHRGGSREVAARDARRATTRRRRPSTP